MQLDRASGVLLHPTSLPSKYGIGELGLEALEFLDFLHECGFKLWQVLPLNPVGYGESPYQSFSAFAGNPMLLSLTKLWEEGLLKKEELIESPCFPEEKVNYKICWEYKKRMLQRAFGRLGSRGLRKSHYQEFIQSNSFWLLDYALFMALKYYFHDVPWNYWDKAIALREPVAVAYWEEKLAEEISYFIFLQYQFFTQWQEIKQYAADKGISIIGDLPLYVAYDSSDAWVHPHLFELDNQGNPLKVGGVPPDYFSETGQLWGNPIYKWEEMEKDDYLWWRERIKVLMELVDVIRIDHFRGFEAYWEVPGSENTAVNGKWVKGPSEKFFSVITKYLGQLPLLAEDLGFITPEVVELKNKFGFPGMNVLQFLDRESICAPQTDSNWVYYTGTHDNDTLMGWWEATVLSQLHPENREKWRQEICWEFIELVFQSRAKWVIIPLQDLLGLDTRARMNIPGTIGGDNWCWRFKKDDINGEIAAKVHKLVTLYKR